MGLGQRFDEKTGDLLVRAFLWDDGDMIDLGSLPGFQWSAALDVNDEEGIEIEEEVEIEEEDEEIVGKNKNKAKIGKLNAANASPTALENASPHSAVGAIASYVDAVADDDVQAAAEALATSNKSVDDAVVNAVNGLLGIEMDEEITSEIADAAADIQNGVEPAAEEEEVEDAPEDPEDPIGGEAIVQ